MKLPLSQASIVQFGTSRFLLGHVAAFAAQAIENGNSQEAILVVQTSSRPEGKAKAVALAQQASYPLHIRGLRNGQPVDEQLSIGSVAGCLVAQEQWQALEHHFIYMARWVISNTGDSGYQVADDTSLADVPSSFPGKLTKLLYARFSAGQPGLTLLPCELIGSNGHVLKEIVLQLARRDYHDTPFEEWLAAHCCWVNTLVDRIVSAPLEPVGAVAEPYALWAIQQTPGLVMPFEHPAVEMASSLQPFELRKLHILNLAHTYLVDQWRQNGLTESVTYVREAMQEPWLRNGLSEVMMQEVLPVLARELPDMDLNAYWHNTLERFDNPYLDHRLEDIANYHGDKLTRRLEPVVELGIKYEIATPRLCAALGRK
ncbi:MULTISPECIES: mannitol dehydrogenase [Halomonadaceae]|uniref:Mannitol dehydrogenase n=2 Tax=Vreelandella TaxID=3137766 RepID=A0A7Z0RXD0_9GAMM|nr:MULTISPECIES: mannitol dehydrogenase [unclassified Halomonas]AJY51275.1 Tagaturonate reductase [Halomonas sp. KO116]NYS77204.1 mannitol dehydrogenase [Halomonas glaciei]